MKALFTADTQADFENLELCRRTVEEILRLRDRHGFQVLVHCGDLKHVYNPIDTRVITFWMRAIEKFREAGLRVVICLGNHDRVGMHVDKQNWFPVLRRAGADCFDDPHLLELGEGGRLAILPYRRDSVLLRREASDLAKLAKAGNTVLVFHGDIKSGRYNVLSRSESELVASDLCPEKYVYCIGGHVHFQQKIVGNVFYVGSPFATDWGEANQHKGYLLYDFELKKLSRVRSEIPGWYDPSWPGFMESKPKSWKGTHVRIKVKCDGIQNVREKLAAAEREASVKYAGAKLFVIPEFTNGSHEGLGRIKASFPDEKKIQVYLQETLPTELKKHEQRIKTYLLSKLAAVGGLQREQGELHFCSWKAKNFLSYKELEFRIEDGLYVVSGKNMDWKNKSNGSGKTSFLQPLAVAAFGQTFKDQKHDGWMRSGTGKTDESWVKLWFLDSEGRGCQIWRGRQPKILRLKVNKEIIESGNRPESTQKLIEQRMGYTWETLSNAIYVDQSASHLMLTGTEAQRKGFLAKLQNLERFERAEKLIKEEKNDLEARYNALDYELQRVLGEEKELYRTITDAKAVLGVNASKADLLASAKESYLTKKAELDDWEAKAVKKTEEQDSRLTRLREIEKDYEVKLAKVQLRRSDLATRLESLKNLSGECPTCLQDVPAYLVAESLLEVKLAIKNLDEQLASWATFPQQVDKKFAEINKEAGKWVRNQKLAAMVSDLRDVWQELKAEAKAQEQQVELIERLKKRREKMINHICGLEDKKKKFDKWFTVVKYAQTVFQRDGLPAYLNAHVCPELNQSAAEYSELFAQGEIQVRFEVDQEGSMDVVVVNAHGGDKIEDQSEGEKKLASLITSFAVRSIAPKTNLLILDEPGDGLDAISAKAFAKGLREVAGRFCTIIVVSHNEHILSVLSGEQQVSIIKENKVSRVVST
jgi:DNA repair exonuclease SbcCD nuclease subunit